MREMLSVFSPFAKRGSRFRENFLKIASANIVSQVLPLLLSPVLTRLYRPEDFGVLAVFNSLVSFAVAIAVLRMDWLISMERRDSRALNLLVFSVAWTVAVSAVLGMASYYDLYAAIPYVSSAAIGDFMWLLPLVTAGAGLHLILSAWFIRSGDLTPVAHAKVWQSAANTGISVLGGLASGGAIGLLAGVSIASWIGVKSLFGKARASLLEKRKYLSTRSIWLNLSRNWFRIRVIGPTGVVNTAGLHLPAVLIAVNYSAMEAGWYALMYRIAMAPTTSLTTAVTQSFWVEARTLITENLNDLRKLFFATTKKLTVLAAGVGFICLSGPVFIGPLFGSEHWTGAGYVLAALAPLIILNIIVSPLSPMLVMGGRERWLFWWDVIRVCLLVIVFAVVPMFSRSFFVAILIYSLMMAGMYVVLYRKNVQLLKV